MGLFSGTGCGCISGDWNIAAKASVSAAWGAAGGGEGGNTGVGSAAGGGVWGRFCCCEVGCGWLGCPARNIRVNSPGSCS